MAPVGTIPMAVIEQDIHVDVGNKIHIGPRHGNDGRGSGNRIDRGRRNTARTVLHGRTGVHGRPHFMWGAPLSVYPLSRDFRPSARRGLLGCCRSRLRRCRGLRGLLIFPVDTLIDGIS
jgi:hypothetical protein